MRPRDEFLGSIVTLPWMSGMSIAGCHCLIMLELRIRLLREHQHELDV